MGEIDDQIREAGPTETLPLAESAGEILDVAGSDIVEEILPIPEWGKSVKVRSLTAAQSATVRQIGFEQQGDGVVAINWAKMEIAQFQMGCVAPNFGENEVRSLHMKSGRGFARIIAWIDEKSGLDKKAIEEAKERFQGSERPAEV